MTVVIRNAVTFAVIVASTLLFLPRPGFAQTPSANNKSTATSDDGLERMPDLGSTQVWVRPGASLAQYEKLFALPTGVTFRQVEEPVSGRVVRGDETVFPVDDGTKRRMRQYFREAFLAALADTEPLEISNKLGRDVLMIQGFLVDVTSHSRSEFGVHLNSRMVRYPWEALIVLELRDAMSNEVLVRTVDRERSRGRPSGSLDWLHTKQVLDAWASLLAGHFEDIHRHLQTRRPEVSRP